MNKIKNSKCYCLLIGLFWIFPLCAQNAINVTGNIRSSNDQLPLPGVTVFVQGTNKGTVTDFDGDYSLTTEGDAILEFSYLGFISQEIPVNGRSEINVSMSPDNEQLSEVVVIGYGTRTKGAITGAISTVNEEVFESRPLNNSLDALQGTIPGVTITRASGQPGAQGYSLQIRGYSSINGNAPLVLILL